MRVYLGLRRSLACGSFRLHPRLPLRVAALSGLGGIEAERDQLARIPSPLRGAAHRSRRESPSPAQTAPSQSPVRAATPRTAQGTGVERKRDGKPWVKAFPEIRVPKGRSPPSTIRGDRICQQTLPTGSSFQGSGESKRSGISLPGSRPLFAGRRTALAEKVPQRPKRLLPRALKGRPLRAQPRVQASSARETANPGSRRSPKFESERTISSVNDKGRANLSADSADRIALSGLGGIEAERDQLARIPSPLRGAAHRSR